MAEEIVNVEPQPVPEKKRRKAKLDDLKPALITVEVEDVDTDEDGNAVLDEDGNPVPVILEFTMRTLSYFRYNQINAEVIDPSPATMGVGADKRPIFDTNDAGYRQRLNEAAAERTIRRLAEALVDPVIPGNTAQEKAQWMKDNMPTALVNQLAAVEWSTLARGQARIANRANSFQ